MSKTHSIAFFDFDGTLLRGDSTRIAAVASVRCGLLSPGLGARMAGSLVLHKAGLLPRELAYRVGFRCYRGRTQEQLRPIIRDLYQEVVRRWISGPVRQRVRAHAEQGGRVVIATAACELFPEPLARELGIETVLGTRMAFGQDGVCTGEVDGRILDGEAKRARAEAFAQEHECPLQGCTFYTDHIADLPLLEAVGRPIVVEPHRPLRRLALRRGWEILEHAT